MGFEILNSLYFYEYKNFYILTQPKVASSWLHDLYFNSNTKKENLRFFYVNQLTLELIPNDALTDEFVDDWYKLINNETPKKDFIFLMRDPLSKIVTGLMQDVIYSKLLIEVTNINNHQNLSLEEINKFNNFHSKQNEFEWWRNTNIELNSDIERILFILVDTLIQKWFKDPQNIIELRNGHKSTNYFLLYKILKNNIKSKIIDIEKENIFDFIQQTYNFNADVVFKKPRNKTPLGIKNITLESIKKNNLHFYLSTYLQTDILIYCDIFNSIYNTDLSINKLVHKIFLIQ